MRSLRAIAKTQVRKKALPPPLIAAMALSILILVAYGVPQKIHAANCSISDSAILRPTGLTRSSKPLASKRRSRTDRLPSGSPSGRRVGDSTSRTAGSMFVDSLRSLGCFVFGHTEILSGRGRDSNPRLLPLEGMRRNRQSAEMARFPGRGASGQVPQDAVGGPETPSNPARCRVQSDAAALALDLCRAIKVV